MSAELIAKLESASEGSVDLDAMLFRHFGSELPTAFGPVRIDLQWQDDGSALMPIGEMQVRFQAPAVTTSIDAALALAERVLPGWYCGVQPWFHTDPDRVMSRAYLVRPDWKRWNPVDDEWVECRSGKSANTPALAICAALLRASAAEGAG